MWPLKQRLIILVLVDQTKNADLVNLYSKTANINAQVQAEYAITTVTGTNQISDVGQVTPITSNQTTTNTTKPTTAIDIKSLGGMTAGSISLVGTDKGLWGKSSR